MKTIPLFEQYKPATPPKRRSSFFGKTSVRMALLLSMIIIPIAIIDLLEIAEFRHSAFRQAFSNIERLARNAQHDISGIFASTRATLRTLAMTREVRDNDSFSCQVLLAKIASTHDRYAAFVRLDKDGKLACSSDASLRPEDSPGISGPWPGPESDAERVGLFQIGPVPGDPTMLFSVPVASDDPARNGRLAAGLSLNWLAGQMTEINTDDDTRLILFDDSGLVLAYAGSNPTEAPLSIANWPMFADTMKTPDAGVFTTDAAGNKLLAYLVSFADIRGGCHLVAYGSYAPVMSRIAGNAFVRSLGVLSVFVIAMLLAMWVSHRFILRWTNGMAGLAGRIAAGDLQARTGLPRDDSDMSLLAEALDDMAGQIESRQDALRHSQEMFRQIMDNVQQVFWIRDAASGRIIFVNKAFERLWGQPSESLIHNPASFMARVHPDDYPIVTEAMRRQSAGELIDIEFRAMLRQGENNWIHARTFPIRDENGNVIRITGIAEDITARKTAEQDLRQSRTNARALLESSPGGAVLLDIDGVILDSNEVMAARFGLKAKDILGRNMFDFFPPELAAKRRSQLAKAAIEDRVIHSEDSRGDLRLYNVIYPIRDDNGSVTRLAVFSMDISDLKRAEERLRLLAGGFANSSEAIMITDAKGVILEINRAFTDITGYDHDEAVGKNPSILKSGRHDAAFYKDMWSQIYKHGQWSGEVWDRRKDGEIYPKWLSINAVRGDHEEITHFVAIFTDITAIKQTEERLQQLAHYDHLTGLPNRILFRDRLRQAMIRADRHGSKVALLFLDLDRFKNINDTLGHKAGDTLLTETASRLSGCVRQSDTVARLGGDEFTVILTEIRNADDVADIAETLVKVFTTPFSLEGREVYITPSVGITLYPNDAANPDELIKNADAAMYQAKEHGRNNFQFYSKALHAKASERLALETDLRNAVARREFVVYYQPRIDARTGLVAGAEALVRWLHPSRGLVPPDRFIPLAEETGLIEGIGDQVLEMVGRFGSECRLSRNNGQSLLLAVNLSARQFRRDNLAAQLAELIGSCGLDGCLEVEITETMLMADIEETRSALVRLKELGIQISIDDFGTGYSSLGYLKTFPIDILKIDRSFIRDLPDNNDAAMIAKAVLALGHSLGLKVVAEGVETAAQAEFLRQAGCDQFQGYFFHRPMPEEEFRQLLLQSELCPKPELTDNQT